MTDTPSYDELVQKIKALEYELQSRERMESRFREDEAHLLAVLENMPIACFTFDHRSRFMTWNRAAEDIYGYTKQEALGISAYELIATPKNKEFIDRILEKVFNGEFMNNLEWQDRGRRGVVGWRMGCTFPLFRSDHTVLCGVGLVIDITERKQTENNLVASKEQYHNLLDKVPVSIILTDEKGRIVDVNPFHLNHLAKGKVAKTNFLGKNICTHPIVLQSGLTEEYRSVLNGNELHIEAAPFPSTSNGQQAYFTIRGIPQKKDDRVTSAIFLHEDVTQATQARLTLTDSRDALEVQVTARTSDLLDTNQKLLREIEERRQAETALKQSQNQFQSIMDSMEAMIYVADMATHEILFANRNIKDLMGDPSGKKCWQYLQAKQDGPCPFCTNDKLLDESGQPTGVHVWEMQNTRDNQVYECRDQAIQWVDGRMVRLEIATRITERKQTEKAVLNSRKMEAITMLAGGVAHQFNNKLVGITGNVDLLKMEEPDNKAIARYTKRISTAAEQMAHLTRQLLSYSRQGKYDASPTPINLFTKNVLSRVPALTTGRIQLETDLASDEYYADIDETQMQLVVTALLNNALEAIQTAGTIKVTTRCSLVSDAIVRRYSLATKGPYICITVSDTGQGMGEETLQQVFDPFFSTKLQGRGLGMAAALGIVYSHRGFIELDSQPDQGTRAAIYLPESDPTLQDDKNFDKNIAKESCTILVIDDEKMVADIVFAALKEVGFQVLLAATGREGIQLAREYRGDIDMVLLDIGLPDMDGKEVFPAIVKIRPGIKVIVCSGYTIDGTAQEIITAGARGFLQKPFTISDLFRVIKEAQ